MDSDKLAETIEFLTGVPFFSEVSRDALAQLCSDLSPRQLAGNEKVFHKGDQGDAMYVILNGEVRVHEGEHTFGHLGATECFGEYALVDNMPRSASVTTSQQTEILEIPRDRFMELMLSDSGFAKGMLAVMIKRHRELDAIQEKLAVSEKNTAQAHAQMSGLINGAMDAILMFDEKFRIILCNSAANVLLENDDVLQRNALLFFDESSANLIESIVKEDDPGTLNCYLPGIVKVIGSNERETLNEGTISKYGDDGSFYTLILRNVEDRLKREDTINLLTTQAQYLEEEIKELTSSYGILAEDPSMQVVIEAIGQVAKTEATVLITGETGTGKELVARAIHMASDRNDKPLIRINCGAIPANLIESELFGHEKGAFTGATSSRKGRFLIADQGTIFLDEIGELPIDLQPKLLRVIQEGEFDPVGSNETVKVDVRILAATHRNLLEHAEKGKFREDLYYRLNVFPINVPPLRDRGNDICLIAEEMIRQFSAKLNKPAPTLTEADKNNLMKYPWPGNVRELQNLVERAVIVSQNGNMAWDRIIPNSRMSSEEIVLEKEDTRVLTSEELVAFEKENILKALRQTHWKISGKNGAASLLNMAPTTLASRIKALGLSRPV